MPAATRSSGSMGDILQVSADIFKDGHDKIAAVVKYRRQVR